MVLAERVIILQKAYSNHERKNNASLPFARTVETS